MTRTSPIKIKNKHRTIEDCSEHTDCFMFGCKTCHQISLDFIELRLMDLDAEIKALKLRAKMDIEKGANSKWGWTE